MNPVWAGNAVLVAYSSAISIALLVCARERLAGLPVAIGTELMVVGTGLLLAIHCMRGWSAIPAVFSEWQSSAWPSRAWVAMIVLALGSCVSGLRSVCSPALFAIYATAFLVSTLYSIENVLFQNLLFHSAILAIGDIALWRGTERVECQVIVLTSCCLHFAILMHGGAVEKVRSPIWIRGSAGAAFLAQRHLVSTPFARYVPYMWPSASVVGSYLVLAAEAALLPSCVHPYATGACCLVLLGFAVSLFTIFDLSFIGQILVVYTMLVWAAFGAHLGGQPFPDGLDGIHPLQLGLALSLFMTSLAVHEGPWRQFLRLDRLQHAFSGVNSPVRVFTETHLANAWIYRFLLNGEPLADERQVFTAAGGPGGLQWLRPRYLQSAMYAAGRASTVLAAGRSLTASQCSLLAGLCSTARRLESAPGSAAVTLLVSPACQAPDAVPTWTVFPMPTCSGEGVGIHE